MKIRTLSSIALAVIAALIAQLPGDTSARVAQRKARRSSAYAVRTSPGQFNVSVRYSGLLSGTVNIGGRDVTITPATKFYITGKGLVDEAPLLAGNAIYVSGARRGSKDVANMVMIRPRAREGSGKKTGIAPENADR